MALSEIRAIVVDLDTACKIGLIDVYESIARNFKKGKYPAVWLWIPDTFQGFYANKMLYNAKGIDYYLVGPLNIGDLLPHQVLLFSRSVTTLLPVREKKICQTIIGDSLAVLDQANNKFSNQYKFEFSQQQRDFLVTRRQSRIFRYLKTDCGIEELNRSMWIQERCEGTIIYI